MSGVRYRSLDVIRGVAILNMAAYHLLWDLVYMFGFEWSWYGERGGYIWQQGICWTFILLSGFSYSFGHRKLRRGGTVLLLGFLMYVVTYLVMPENCIRFGVLTLIGSCMLLLIPFQNGLRKIRPVWGILAGVVLFVLTRNVNRGYLGFEGWNWLALPKEWYRNLLTAYLGFKPTDFFSTDYFSLIPWSFLYLAGFYLHELFVQKGWMHHLTGGGAKPLEWLGRHSLEIYVLHQPVIYLVCLLALQ